MIILLLFPHNTLRLMRPRWLPDNRSMKSITLLFLLCCTTLVYSQGQAQQAAPVRYTEALRQPVQQTVELPGYLEAPYVSVLASEVEGLVAELKVREGQQVTRGQPLVVLRTTALALQLQAAEARLAEAEARRKLAQTSLTRAQGLVEKNTISRQQLDEARYEFEAWQGRIDTLRAEAASIRHDIERSTLRAPFDGIIIARYTEVGQWRDAGAGLLELLSDEAQEVHVDVPEQYFSELQTGAPVTVTFDSVPGREYPASIRAVIPRADPAARTFPVKLRLRATHAEIGAGMAARAALQLGEPTPGTLVPKDALVRQGDNTLVFLVKQGSALLTPVTVGAAMGVWVVVSGAVSAGDKVVTRGNERLFPGQPIAAEPLAYPRP